MNWNYVSLTRSLLLGQALFYALDIQHDPQRSFIFHGPYILVGLQAVSQLITQCTTGTEKCYESVLKAFQARKQKIQMSVGWSG